MHCDGCVRKSTQLISSIPGVNSVQISLVTSKLILSADREISFDEISNALKDTNYKLTKEAPNFFSVFRRWFKKYLALIVVFSVIIIWTTVRQILFGLDLHFAMHDFMGGFFLILGGLKVFNWKKFAEGFQGYDPLAMKFPVYAYVYPALEVFLGVVYQFRLGEELLWNIMTVLILGISMFGIAQVLKRKEIVKCACLGGYFNIPITWFTVFENGLMIFMAIYMQLVFGAI